MKNFVCKSRAEFVVKENLTVVVGRIKVTNWSKAIDVEVSNSTSPSSESRMKPWWRPKG